MVQISAHRVIYHLLEEVKAWTQAMTPKVEKEVVLGEADVLQVMDDHPATSPQWCCPLSNTAVLQRLLLPGTLVIGALRRAG